MELVPKLERVMDCAVKLELAEVILVLVPARSLSPISVGELVLRKRPR